MPGALLSSSVYSLEQPCKLQQRDTSKNGHQIQSKQLEGHPLALLDDRIVSGIQVVETILVVVNPLAWSIDASMRRRRWRRT